MAAVNEAWRVLGDPARRASYDASLTRPSPSPHTVTPAAPSTGWVGGDEAAAYGEPETRSFWVVALPWILVLVVLGGIFLFTAYARGGLGGDSPAPVRPVDGVIELESCIALDGAARAVETGCGGPHVGVVRALVAPGAPCPPQTEGFFSVDGSRLICITRD